MSTKRKSLPRNDRAVTDVPAQGPTIAETAYRRIRNDIMAGELKPGLPLRLQLLRQRYGFSFSPIREALNRLQTERLVASIALRGFSVAPFSREEIVDTMDTRILIECEALRRSIANGKQEWEEAIVATFHALSWHAKSVAQAKHAPTSEQIDGLEVRHRNFHNALITACRSSRLLDFANQLYAQSERYRRPSLLDGASRKPSRNVTAEHKNIMDATLKRDAKKACSLLEDHYRRTAASIDKFIEHFG